MSGSINLADVGQFLVGSDQLKITPFFIKNFTIPSIAFSHPELSTRSGVKLHVGADSIDFNELNLDVVLDSNFSTYFELLDITFSEVDWEHDSFAMPSFDLWVQVLNSNKIPLFRIDFKNCRVSSIGEVALDPSAELGSTIAVGIRYDYWTYARKECINGDESCRKGPNRWYNDKVVK